MNLLLRNKVDHFLSTGKLSVEDKARDFNAAHGYQIRSISGSTFSHLVCEYVGKAAYSISTNSQNSLPQIEPIEIA